MSPDHIRLLGTADASARSFCNGNSHAAIAGSDPEADPWVEATVGPAHGKKISPTFSPAPCQTAIAPHGTRPSPNTQYVLWVGNTECLGHRMHENRKTRTANC